MSRRCTEPCKYQAACGLWVLFPGGSPPAPCGASCSQRGAGRDSGVLGTRELGGRWGLVPQAAGVGWEGKRWSLCCSGCFGTPQGLAAGSRLHGGAAAGAHGQGQSWLSSPCPGLGCFQLPFSPCRQEPGQPGTACSVCQELTLIFMGDGSFYGAAFFADGGGIRQPSR